MSSVHIVLGALTILSVSGLPAYFFSIRSSYAQVITTGIMFLGAAIGVYGVIISAMGNSVSELTWQWMLPIGAFSLRFDSLSCVFLLPVLVIPALGSMYGLGYWNIKNHAENGRRLGVFYGILAGSMGFVVLASDSILFLVSWEIMALAAFFAATIEDQDKQVRMAGWVYLIATHIGTLLLFGMFALWHHTTGSFALETNQSVSTGIAGVIFVLAIIGFGFKAGIFPLHVWLPGAHANAPSHVSAVMSGVMLKIGIYGIIRMTSLLPITEFWWGGVLMSAGAVTAIVGIVYAIGQQDLKRILAYSSIENIGIITMGLGLSLAGKYYNRTDLVVYGLTGALLHVWNHSLFKSLLFFNAGAVIHSLHSRNIEMMGGIGKRMPWTTGLFILGAIAIAALPPLNGFISEWLLYLGFFRSLDISEGGRQFTVLPMGALALAVAGPCVIACFVKVLGTVFLGAPRSNAVEHAKEPPLSMILPMVITAAGCLLIGLFPKYPVALLMNSVTIFVTEAHNGLSEEIYSSLSRISFIGIALFVAVGVLVLLLRKSFRKSNTKTVGTWDCGYAKPSNSMQYSGSSLSDTIVKLFSFILYPVTRNPEVTGHFPQKVSFKTMIPDVVLDILVVPLFKNTANFMIKSRVFQRGQMHLYVLYILLIVVLLFVLGR